MKRTRWSIPVAMACLAAFGSAGPANACPFCNAISQTLSEQVAASDVTVVAKLESVPDLNAPQETNRPLEKSTFQVLQILKGDSVLGDNRQIATNYLGQAEVGTTFLLFGTQEGVLLWSVPIPVTRRGIEYVTAALALPPQGPSRLAFFQKHFEDKESHLAGDAYEEFARAPYSDLLALRDDMDRGRLVGWIQDPRTSANHRRLYLTMLGVCGGADDLPLLESMLAAKDRKPSSGLDALVACYVKLKGPDGLPLIEDLFLKNRDAPSSDTLAALIALRFIAQQTDVVPRRRVVEALYHMLDREEADLVIADLARWEDWSVMPRLVELFKNPPGEPSWVRQPIARYLMECPLPEAKQHLKELRAIDAESVERAGSVLAMLGSRGRVAATGAAEGDTGESVGDVRDAPPDAAGDPEPQGEEALPAADEEGSGADGEPDAPEVDERDAEARGQPAATKVEQRPPRYLTVLGIPFGLGCLLFAAIWFVLGGTHVRRL